MQKIAITGLGIVSPSGIEEKAKHDKEKNLDS